MYPRQLGRFRCQDSLGVRDRSADELETRLRPDERQYDIGNSQYVMTLPGSEGDFEAEDAGDMMKIFRVGNNSREFVCAVPAGSRYRMEVDESGAHLYRMPDDDPERVPLSDMPINLGATDHMAALKRTNDRMARHYGADQSGTQHVAHRDLTGGLDSSSHRAALAYINARNREAWGTR